MAERLQSQRTARSRESIRGDLDEEALFGGSPDVWDRQRRECGAADAVTTTAWGDAAVAYTTPPINDVIAGYEGYTGGDLYLTAEVGSRSGRSHSTSSGRSPGGTTFSDTPGGNLAEAPGASVSFQMTARVDAGSDSV